jgi:hypothetical protein
MRFARRRKIFSENLPINNDEKRTMDLDEHVSHDYREEPNVRFSPDRTMVFFSSNLFGASYVLLVEVSKAENPAAADGNDTAELGGLGISRLR